MSRVIGKVVLTEAEERKVIRRYAQMEHSIKPSDKCSIGVGYTTCMDIGFRAVDLFQAIQPQIEKLEKEGKIKPYVHAQITNLRMFIETFLYYFSNGANAERSCVRYCYRLSLQNSRELFTLLSDTIQQTAHPLNHSSYIGGHSSVWALRAQKEGCLAFIAAQSTPFYQASLRLS